MEDFHALLGFDEVYDESFKNVFPLLQKLNIKKNHTIASESGHFVSLLNKNGIPSSGSDIFSPIVALSKTRYPDIDFSVKDMRNFQLNESVDLITCMDGCINHVFSLAEVFDTFKSVYNNLLERGYFYFELWTLDEVSEKNMDFEKEYKIGEYDILQSEKRLGNNIHNMCTCISKDGNIIDILNAYHTAFDYDAVLELLIKAGFKKYKELSFSSNFSKKILAFKY